MKLAIDIREACRAHLAGKGRWTRGFLCELLEHEKNIVLYSDIPLPSDLAQKTQGCDVRVIQKQGLGWHMSVARDVEEDTTIEVYISTVSYIVPCLLKRSVRVVTIVHDLIAFRSEPHDWRSTFIERITLKRALKRSALICTVSKSTADDLQQKFSLPSTTSVVPIFAGCDLESKKSISKGNGCVLCIGTLCPRKNQLRLIEAHAQLSHAMRKKHPLVLIGSRGWSDRNIVRAAQSTDFVSWIGGCSDDERNRLLQDAALCAFPSLYEGFGLPVLEAFASGVPVLTSVNGSLKEVANDAAYFVDPLSVDSIKYGLVTMLEQKELCDSLAQKGLHRASLYTWGHTIDLFQKAVKNIDRSN